MKAGHSERERQCAASVSCGESRNGRPFCDGAHEGCAGAGVFCRRTIVPGSEPVVVLSHKVWLERYAGLAGVIGRHGARRTGRRRRSSA
jgi:hypothetical protein